MLLGNNYGIDDDDDDDDDVNYLQKPIQIFTNRTPNIPRTPLLKVTNSTPLNHWGGDGSGIGSSYARKFRKHLYRSQLW